MDHRVPSTLGLQSPKEVGTAVGGHASAPNSFRDLRLRHDRSVQRVYIVQRAAGYQMWTGG